MSRPADMTERELADALHAVSDKLCTRLPERARKLLERHHARLVAWLSIRLDDRADLEEQRRVDEYLDDCRGANASLPQRMHEAARDVMRRERSDV